MGSVEKLRIFLSENNHDIIDYWTRDEKLYWIRVISRRIGNLFFINVSMYQIRYKDAADTFVQKNVYSLSVTDHPRYQDHLTRLSPILPAKLEYIIFFGNEVYDSDHRWYTAKNVLSSPVLSLYILVSLDWFYENALVVYHKIVQDYLSCEKLFHDYIVITTQKILSFLRNSKAEIDKIQTLVHKSKSHFQQLEQSQKLYVSVCKSKTNSYTELLRLDNMIHHEDVTFKSAVHRQYLRKKCNDRLDRLEELQSNIVTTIIFHNQQHWNYTLQVVHKLACIEYNILLIQEHFQLDS
jgi:hypothetical protein